MPFGVYLDGLEKHLVDIADINAPTLMGVMVLQYYLKHV